MTIVHEIYAEQIDYSQVWNGTFQFVNVDHLVDFFLLILHSLLVCSNQVQNFKAIDEVVDLSHEAFHEDYFGQANAHCSQLGGKRMKVIEVVQLHRRGKVQ